MTPKEYTQSGKYLPKPLKDFHDAKDFFKLMHRKYGEQPEGISWRSGQIYVIDWFLWFMAQRGWTLQKCRANVDFYDLDEEIQEMKEEDAKIFWEMMQSVSKSTGN